jgi:4-amino-4-deoxy-L-arabinose transferase-like glycosyltransferase
MTMSRAPDALLGPARRLVAVLTDPGRRERAAVAVIAVYAALWALTGMIAKAGEDVHYDMAEMVAGLRGHPLSLAHHPPFGAWVANLWFAIFPVADWPYYLLAMTVVGFGLWVAWHIAGWFLDSEKRVLGLALLTFVPLLNWHALKYNANTILIPLWAATTWWFLRSLETHSALFAALAGLGAAACMLGKYWSIFLLAGLAFAAVSDPHRRAYFRSKAPWITIAVGALALMPHLLWLARHEFSSFDYALAVHHGLPPREVVAGVAEYVFGTAAYLGPAALIALVVTRPDRAAIADTLWPREPKRRTLAVAYWAPLLLPVTVTFPADVRLVSIWTMPALTLLPVVWLSSARVAVGRAAVERVVTLAMVIPVAMIAIAPFIAIAAHRAEANPEGAHGRLLAAEIEKAWRRSTDRPLRFVAANDGWLAYGSAFYLRDAPAALVLFDDLSLRPYVDFTMRSLAAGAVIGSQSQIGRNGVAIVCAKSDWICGQYAERMVRDAPNAHQTEVTLSRPLFGMVARPQSYRITIRPPAR